MVSVPMTVIDYSKPNLYPTAVSPAFAYQGSYTLQPTLANGPGYWLRFNGAQTVSMTGLLRPADTISVTDGGPGRNPQMGQAGSFVVTKKLLHLK